MAIAASTSLPITSPSRAAPLSSVPALRSASLSPASSSIPFSIRTGIAQRSPSFRISMTLQAPEKSLGASSFLDRRENGFLQFVKYHGLGNDFILVDNRKSSEPRITPEQAVKLCDHNFGIGAGGVIFAMPGINGTDYSMRIFNSDGSEPEMCRNGV